MQKVVNNFMTKSKDPQNAYIPCELMQIPIKKI